MPAPSLSEPEPAACERLIDPARDDGREFCCRLGAEEEGIGGEVGRDGGWGPKFEGGGCEAERLFFDFFAFLRAIEDSLPEASEARGEPGRLREVEDADRGIPEAGLGEGCFDWR